MTDSLRVLLVTLDYPPPPGGIQTVVKNLEDGLTELGHECEVLHLDRGEFDPAITDLVPRPRWLYGADSLRKWDYPYLNAVYRRTRERIDAFDPDVVHAMHVKDWPALVAARESGVPRVLSTYALELQNRPLTVRAIDDANVVHAITSFTESLVLDRAASPESTDTVVVPPSIQVAAYRSARERHESASTGGAGPVVTLARFVDRKNIETVVRAWGELDAAVTDDRELVVAGDGPNRERLERIAEGLDGVSFPGWISEREKRELLAAADAFAMVPRRDGYDVEGFGIVYVEAQAARTPVVGSRHGGAPEAIGDAGIVVDDEDDPAAVAAALETLLTDDDRRAACLRAAERRIDTFDVPAVAQRHADVYRRITGKQYA